MAQSVGTWFQYDGKSVHSLTISVLVQTAENLLIYSCFLLHTKGGLKEEVDIFLASVEMGNQAVFEASRRNQSSVVCVVQRAQLVEVVVAAVCEYLSRGCFHTTLITGRHKHTQSHKLTDGPSCVFKCRIACFWLTSRRIWTRSETSDLQFVPQKQTLFVVASC